MKGIAANIGLGTVAEEASRALGRPISQQAIGKLAKRRRRSK